MTHVTTKSLAQMTLDAFEWLEKNASRFSRNEQQISYATLVANSIEKGGESRANGGQSAQLLVEGETGTGKTLGYLVPAMLQAATTDSRAVVSTFTLHLQRQIMKAGGDFELAALVVKALTGKTLSVSRRVGRQAFIDVDRVLQMEAYYEEQDESESAAIMSGMLEWMSATQSGELADWLIETECELPDGLESGDITLSSASSDPASIFYAANVAKAKNSDVVLVTHAMLCLAGKCGWRLLHDSNDTRRIGALVIDEADRLPMVAQNLAGSFVSIYSLTKQTLDAAALVDLDSSVINKAGKHLWETISAAYIPGSEKGIVFWQSLSTTRQSSIRMAIDEFVVASKDMIAKLRALMKDLSAMQNAKNRDIVMGMIESWVEMNEVRSLLDEEDAVDVPGASVGKGSMSGVALRWSPKKEYPSLKTFSLNPAHILRKLWSAYTSQDGSEGRAAMVDCLVITSATISTPGKERASFEQSIFDYGIWEKDNPCKYMHASFSPKLFGSTRFVFPDASVHVPFDKNDEEDESDEEPQNGAKINPEWLSYAAMMADKAGGEGRTLVLVGSYRTTIALAEALRERGTDVIEHRRGDKLSTLIEKMKGDPNSILISPSAWEGVDEPHFFDNVVIAQLPYRSPDDVHGQALMNYLVGVRGKLGAEARSIIQLNNITTAMRKFKQGFGRGIRAVNDSFTLWVADPRFPASKTFSDDITGAVPVSATRRFAHQFIVAIPVRFRSGIGNPFDEGSRLLKKDGKFLSTDDLE